MTRKRPIPTTVEDVQLSSSVTVKRYLKLESLKNKDEIVDFIKERFEERYLGPFLSYPSSQARSGFSIMAICCLMIEALESFRQGWENSDGKSQAAFCYFFDTNEPFKDFRGHSQEFYKHIRCGILHQAETTGGWLIRRDQPVMFDPNTRVIDASQFLKTLDTCLENYCEKLRDSDWNDLIWVKFRKKMLGIIKNCNR